MIHWCKLLLLLQRLEAASGHAGAAHCSTRRVSSRACAPAPGLPAELQTGASTFQALTVLARVQA